MSGALFWLMEKLVKKKLVITVILIFLSCFLVLVSIKFFVPQKYLQVNSDYYTNQLALEWRTSKISDEYLPKNFQRPANSNQVASFAKLNSKKLTVQLVNDKTQEITLKTNASEKENVTLPSAYFPSWQGYIDNKQILVKDNQGKIAVNIPQGQHQLKLIFQQTRVELLADLISLVGVLALFAGIIQLKKKYA
jgi:uncharacterized membrane protein